MSVGLTIARLARRSRSDMPLTQCAAVTIHLSEIAVPPQRYCWFPSDTRSMTNHGVAARFAAVPLTTRFVGAEALDEVLGADAFADGDVAAPTTVSRHTTIALEAIFCHRTFQR